MIKFTVCLKKNFNYYLRIGMFVSSVPLINSQLSSCQHDDVTSSLSIQLSVDSPQLNHKMINMF